MLRGSSVDPPPAKRRKVNAQGTESVDPSLDHSSPSNQCDTNPGEPADDTNMFFAALLAKLDVPEKTLEIKSPALPIGKQKRPGQMAPIFKECDNNNVEKLVVDRKVQYGTTKPKSTDVSNEIVQTKRQFTPPVMTGPISKLTTWTTENLCFMSEKEVKESATKKRSIVISSHFNKLQDYKDLFMKAIFEELNLALIQFAQKYHAGLPKDPSYTRIQKQHQLRKTGLRSIYYDNELVKNLPEKRFFKKGAPIPEPQIFLKIPDSSKEHSSAYSKDDLWMISTGEDLLPKNIHDLFFFARSIYHGRSQNGMLGIKPYFPDNPKVPLTSNCTCLKTINAATEFSMLDNVSNLSNEQFPLLPYLLDYHQATHQNVVPHFTIGLDESEINRIESSILEQYMLNDDQRRVLSTVKDWFLPCKQENNVILVHGVFGSGKSYTLVVLIIFLSTLLDEAGEDDVRILVSAATNTAVDRILLGLLELDFDNFIRVGSLKRISKKILPYTLYREKKDDTFRSKDRQDSVALRDLKELLDSSANEEERNIVLDMMAAVKNGQMENRINKLKQTRVVGVTCAASVFPVLSDNKFSIVILDECSQMVEPLSLLPISRFGCAKLLLVGDPMQLPPTLTSFADNETDGLGKTLFSRMVEQNVTPVMLRTQYRLHPHLSAIVNKLFYSNHLLDGVSPEQRSGVVPHLPPLLFLDMQDDGREIADPSGSLHNPFEARVVMHILKLLGHYGINGGDIGVISLYKAQEQRLQSMVQKVSEEWKLEERESYQPIQSSTVDAFQGAERATTRTSKLGFIDSPNRTNVALTRAKRHMIIIGKKEVLNQSQYWSEVVRVAESGGAHLGANAFLFGDTFSVKEERRKPTAAKEWVEPDAFEEQMDEMRRMEAEMDSDGESGYASTPRVTPKPSPTKDRSPSKNQVSPPVKGYPSPPAKEVDWEAMWVDFDSPMELPTQAKPSLSSHQAITHEPLRPHPATTSEPPKPQTTPLTIPPLADDEEIDWEGLEEAIQGMEP